jgi:hypothetical protein
MRPVREAEKRGNMRLPIFQDGLKINVLIKYFEKMTSYGRQGSFLWECLHESPRQAGEVVFAPWSPEEEARMLALDPIVIKREET